MALQQNIKVRRHGKKEWETFKSGNPNDLRLDFKKLQSSRTHPEFEEVRLSYDVVLKKHRMTKPDTKKATAETKTEAKKPAETKAELPKSTVHTAPIHRPLPPTHRTPVK